MVERKRPGDRDQNQRSAVVVVVLVMVVVVVVFYFIFKCVYLVTACAYCVLVLCKRRVVG